MDISRQLQEAVSCLQTGGVIAYPTESVYGLGCDPLNELAVMRLLGFKKRTVNKGVILIGSNWEQLAPFVAPIESSLLEKAFATWPGPYTWIFPAAKNAPPWITGDHTSIALRITAHPVANRLCKLFNHALVSTSANLEGQPPAKNADEIKQIFSSQLDYIVQANVGDLAKPTEIRDILTDKILRPGSAK